MDTIFTAYPTSDMDTLKKQIEEFESLPFNLQKRSDEDCKRKYGKSNRQMFDLMRSDLNDKYEEENYTYSSIVSEKVVFDQDPKPSNQIDTLEDKINKAKQLEKEGLCFIYPYCPYCIYDLHELEDMYQRYMNLSSSQKDLSDHNSVVLFGYNINGMYAINKAKIQTMNMENNNTPIEDYSLHASNEQYGIEDTLDLLKKRIDCSYIKSTGSVLESTIADSLHKELKDNCLFVQDKLPNIIPNLLPTEIIDNLNNISKSDEKDIDDYSRSLVSGLIDFDSDLYEKKILNIYNENKPDKDIELIKLGWNPNATPTLENGIYTSLDNEKNKLYGNRVRDFIQEITNIKVVDVKDYVDTTAIDKYDLTLEPVYIILSYTNTLMGNIINTVKKSQYSHCSISFDESLDKMYSFNFRDDYDGLTLESLKAYKEKKIAKLKVIAIFLTKNQKIRLINKLNYFIDNQELTKYSVRNLFRILFNKVYDDEFNLKMVCSQFVDSLLRAANVDVTGKHNNLVSPSDFEKSKNPKLFVVFEGDAKKYNKTKVKVLVDALRINKKNAIKIKECSIMEHNTLMTSKDLVEIKSLTCYNEDVKEFMDTITAESIFVDIKKQI